MSAAPLEVFYRFSRGHPVSFAVVREGRPVLDPPISLLRRGLLPQFREVRDEIRVTLDRLPR